MIKQLSIFLLTPIKAFRIRYLPLMMIYFAYGASTFSGIAESFFVKERLDLSAAALMMIGVWLTLPWTIKMVFGQFADSIPILGSIRKSYIYIAACLMACSSILMAGLAAKWPWVMMLGSQNAIFIGASLVGVIGVVLQDVVADAMTVEVVPREGRSDDDIKKDLAMVQLLGRLSLSLAMFIVAGLGGWLAQIYSYETIFLMTLLIPLIAVSGSLFIKMHVTAIKPINWQVLGGGILYAIFVVAMAMAQFPYHQEVVLLVSLLIVIYLLRTVAGDLPSSDIKKIAFAAIVIFVYRAMPSVGPGLQWWEIDVLGFNKAFFGTLAQIGSGLSIVGMWVFAKYITEKPIGLVFIVLTIIGFLLSLPVIGMYYGLHHWTQEMFGFGAHTIALVDTAVASPFAQLSMIPMLTLVAIYAPKGNAATWFALMGSLMNLALVAAGIVSKTLNKVWVVTREVKDAAGHVVVHANYSHLGTLLIVTTLAGLIIPIVTILIFLPPWKKVTT